MSGRARLLPLVVLLASAGAVLSPATGLVAAPVVTTHGADDAPAGVDVTAPLSTEQLTKRLDARPALAPADVPLATTSADVIPTGAPVVPELSKHVSPSCTGDGTDGNRVQAVYAVTADQPSRYASLRPVIAGYIADVDDVFALSSRETGGGRRVRWVTTADCAPVIRKVVLPAGSLASFGTTITALTAAGLTDPKRKYLVWADANVICGQAQLFLDDALQNNWNDGLTSMFARVDTGCWSNSEHSSAAHELVHALGGVQSTAPHATAHGHCTDDSDVMCYQDGAGVTLTKRCGSSHEHLLDCGHDDYFSTAPAAGSYLDSHWNVADSKFLATVPALPAAPSVSISAPSSLRPGSVGTVSMSVAGGLPAGSTVRWAASDSRCSFGARSATTSTLACGADMNGTVSVTAAVALPSGVIGRRSRSIAMAVPASPLSLATALGASDTSVGSGSSVTLTSKLRYAGKPVKGQVRFWSRSLSSSSYTLVKTVDTGLDGNASVKTTASSTKEWVVTVLTGRTYKTGQPAVKVAVS